MRCTSALFLLVLSHALAIHLPLPCADANCTSYLQRALDACSSAPCTITLDAGTYALSGAPFNASSTHPVVPRLSLTGAAGVALVGAGAGGGGTTLILDDISTTLYISDSANVSISGLAIDLARVPYTLARVVALAPRAATLEIDAAAYAFDAAARARWPWLLQAQAVTSFDPANRRIPPGATDLFALPPNALAISVLGGPDARGALNLSIATGALRLGDTVIVRHVAYGATGLEAHRTRGLAVRDVSLLAVAGMGVFTELCGDIAIDGLRLERRGGRPMSINADGVHLTNSRGGSVAVRDCVLEGQGDDGLNIVTTYLDVESISADRTQLQLGKWGALFPAGLYPFEVNDTLVFVTRATMQERGAARVAAVSARNGTVTLAAPLPAGAGVYDLIYARECVADAVEVSRNTFSQNRARGALLKVRNLVARGNFFNWTSGPAAQAIPDGCSWFEGVTLSNWSFVNNTIVSGDYGGDAERAHVFISASAPAVNASGAPLHGTCAAPAGPPVHAGILVADNSFTVGAGRAAFSVGAATGVVVRNNSVAYADGAPLPPADFVGLGLVDSAAEGNVCAARPGGACVVTGFGAVAPPPAPSFVYVEAADPDALCLDGSRFGVFLCKAATNTSWELAIEGGGWAYDLKSCAERARTPLGSSTTWPAQAPKMPCLNSGTNYIYMQYCDGASFSGYRADPLPAPTNASQLLWFRGARNLAAALAVAREHGLADATNFTMTGSSAGGATTIFHMDAVAAAVTAIAPRARVIGKPIAGYFIPSNETFNGELGAAFALHNASGAISAECQAAHAPDGWRCFMPAVAAGYVRTPLFFLQSRFDLWQLGQGELNIPCMRTQPFTPPYKPSSCTSEEDAEISSYGPTFMSYMSALVNASDSPHGGFINACIVHGSTTTPIDGAVDETAFLEWAAGGRKWWLASCNGSTTAGPCDDAAVCVPFP